MSGLESPALPAVVLAAGGSRRMGRPKALLPWDGTTLLAHVCQAARAGGVSRVLVVVQSEPAVRPGAGEVGPVEWVECASAELGQAHSLRCGLSALRRTAGALPAAFLVLLADLAGLRAGAVQAVAQAARSGRGAAFLADYGGHHIPGHPVALAASLWHEVEQLEGDAGARTLFGRHSRDCVWVDLPEHWRPLDVDTPEDYRQLQHQAAPARGAELDAG